MGLPRLTIDVGYIYIVVFRSFHFSVCLLYLVLVLMLPKINLNHGADCHQVLYG